MSDKVMMEVDRELHAKLQQAVKDNELSKVIPTVATVLVQACAYASEDIEEAYTLLDRLVEVMKENIRSNWSVVEQHRAIEEAAESRIN